MKCSPVINNQAFLKMFFLFNMQHQISLNSEGGCPLVLSCNSCTQNILLNALLFWKHQYRKCLHVRLPRFGPTPCQSTRPSLGPALHRLWATMSDKGLSDEAAAAACKDGSPTTKVRRIMWLTKLLAYIVKPNRPPSRRQFTSCASIIQTHNWFVYV